MSDSMARLADLISMAASIAVAILLAIFFCRKNKGRLRPVALFFLLIGPTAIAVHMVSHIGAVGYVAWLKMANGSFTYDFRFYSLLLLAGVLGALSIRLVQQVLEFYTIGQTTKKQWLATAGWIILVAAPTIPFTFIGSLPVQAVIVTAIASFFVRKRSRLQTVAPLTPGQLSKTSPRAMPT